MPKSYRIRTQVGIDKAIKVNLQQDFESINILSLKILQSDVYNRQCSDYGVIVGRVFVNGGLGLPNARVSIFIPLSDEDALNPVISELYPYQSISDVSADGYRYNLLPKESSYDGHVATGTFPTKEEVLLDQSYIEVYDKYYKFTTRTNESGDYMIFGVPLGSQTVFMDCDLSDIGCFSFGPQDLIQAGMATENQVDGNKFKSSTNLSELPQIKTLNKIIEIAPLWGEPEICQLGITRADFDLTSEANIKVEPKATFMGSIISTSEDDAQKISCKPRNNTGNLCELVAGPGQILAIRQTIKNDEFGLPILEEYKLEQGGKVIDGDGAYLVNVPMNLEYVYTNEFGEQAISTDPTIGVPTKGKYRFKFKWDNEGGLQNEIQRANYFVPNIKEHGWNTSDYDDDPLKNGTVSNINFIIPAGGTSFTFTFPAEGGLVYDSIVNGDSFSVSINGSPYFGNTEVIPINAGDQVEVTPSINDVTQQSEVIFKFYNQEYFDLLRSYSFSLDWDDYVDPASAINCEDTFYEFHYNKVYTTAMFLDRYKKGIGRARHLGIKEIDDRGCKSTVNTFPVNDIVRNFDFLFFIFNLLINILAIPILVLLFIAHLVALLWPILKFLLIALGLYFTFQAVQILIDSAQAIVALINEAAGIISTGTGFVINITNILNVVAIAIKIAIIAIRAIFILGLSLAFLALAIFAALKIVDFPRIGLPMISYTDCTTCDCACGNAVLGDDFDSNTVQNDIDQQGQAASAESGISAAGDVANYLPPSAITQVSIFAPINSPGSLNLDHPNLVQVPDTNDAILIENGPFWYPAPGLESPFSHYRSLMYMATKTGSGDTTALSPYILSGAQLAFNRLATGSESLLQYGTGGWLNDGYGVPQAQCVHAPQPFLFSAYDYNNLPSPFNGIDLGVRYLAHPLSETFAQKLNEFNLRDKYFTTGGQVNQIDVKFNSPNPSNTSTHKDLPLVILARKGTLSNLGIGEVFSFQDPKLSNCNVNITGSTFVGTTNQFGNNAVTGTSLTSTISPIPPITVNYANPSNQSQDIPVVYELTYTGESETYLQYPTDIEYFQVITGFTYSQFMSIADTSQSNYDKFPWKYLNHKTSFTFVNDVGLSAANTAGTLPFIPYNLDTIDPTYLNYNGWDIPGFNQVNTPSNGRTINYFTDYENYEIIIMTRGVDPHSPKQTNKYDISKILALPPQSVEIEGEYYLNIPIQGFAFPAQSNTQGRLPETHNPQVIQSNDTPNRKLFFKPYNFKISPSFQSGSIVLNEFINYNSVLPLYYSSIDEPTQGSYTPYWDGVSQINTFVPTPFPNNGVIPDGSQGRKKILPSRKLQTIPVGGAADTYLKPNYTVDDYYFAGGSFIGSQSSDEVALFSTLNNQPLTSGISDRKQYYWNTTWPTQPGYLRDFLVYSPAYYRNTTWFNLGIDINIDQNNQSTDQYLVMRSDRIPTSTCTEINPENNNVSNATSYGLHMNNNFCVFKGGIQSGPTTGLAPDISAGQSQYDETQYVQTLTSTLTCEGMVSLQCYEGTGTNVSVNPNCSVPADRVKQGCYCLLNGKETDNKFFKKIYLIDGLYKADAKLFLEWKTRFTVTFAACRGVFAQVFQNNWINGALYMFSFNKSTTFGLDTQQPVYNYCKDTVLFNEITKGFYYRSSPWNGSDFIGVNSPTPPSNVPPTLLNNFPGLGYNTQRIQFPTTIMDMGPRETFITKVCNDNDFEGYIADQMRATSYKDNSDIIQMGFISRFLNQNFRQRLIPISVGGNNSEGKGIIQFFNSNREGERIDGDFAQALSINSEWNVTPYIEENYPNDYLFFGEDGTDGRSVFGVFFKSTEDEYRYRRRLSPGIETYSSSCGLPVLNYYGFPTDQIVPHYKWQIAGPSLNIFGSEDNNWVTTANQNSSQTGFYTQSYQNLDFENTNEYYKSVNAKYGFITNFDSSGDPEETLVGVQTGLPGGNPVIVGAPFFFYFGLNNGKTAMDKFSKLYLETE
jgi:hypothetical protein